MKVISGILLTAVLSALSLMVLPWWCCSILACIIMYMLGIGTGHAFMAGFVGVGFCWGAMGGWIDIENAGILSSKIGDLFMGISSTAIVFLTGLIGAISGALGGMTGALIRRTTASRAIQSPQ